MHDDTDFGYLMPAQATRYWAAACHAAAAAFLLVPPIGGFLGPLLVWFFKRADDPFINMHGREAVNFQLSVLLVGVLLSAFGLLLGWTCIGFILMPIGVLFFALVIAVVLLASYKALQGEPYRYPLAWRFF